VLHRWVCSANRRKSCAIISCNVTIMLECVDSMFKLQNILKVCSLAASAGKWLSLYDKIYICTYFSQCQCSIYFQIHHILDVFSLSGLQATGYRKNTNFYWFLVIPRSSFMFDIHNILKIFSWKTLNDWLSQCGQKEILLDFIYNISAVIGINLRLLRALKFDRTQVTTAK
jgi:hypothetical protein